MAYVRVPTAYDELIEYLANHATPQQILDFKVSRAAQERVEDLLYKNSADTLTLEEQIELEQIVHFDGVVSELKANALARLKILIV